jgi:hypothetical protein
MVGRVTSVRAAAKGDHIPSVVGQAPHLLSVPVGTAEPLVFS